MPEATFTARLTAQPPFRHHVCRIAHSSMLPRPWKPSRQRWRCQRRCHASSLDAEQSKAGEWLKVAFPHNQGFKDESDGALKEALNEVCNMTVAALLREDEGEILSVQEELYALGEFFSNQGNRKAAVMMYVLYKLCAHEIPEAADALDGLYKEAYLKIGGMLEDSGWELMREGQETNDEAPSASEH